MAWILGWHTQWPLCQQDFGNNPWPLSHQRALDWDLWGTRILQPAIPQRLIGHWCSHVAFVAWECPHPRWYQGPVGNFELETDLFLANQFAAHRKNWIANILKFCKVSMLSMCLRNSTMFCLQWKILACLIAPASALDLVKNLLHPSKSSKPIPLTYVVRWVSWHRQLWACPWNKPTSAV